MTIEGLKRDTRKYSRDAFKGFVLGSAITAPVAITIRNYMDKTGFARATPAARVAIVGSNVLFGGLVGTAGYTNGAMRREISKRNYDFNVSNQEQLIPNTSNAFTKVVLGSFLGVLGVGYITVMRSPFATRQHKLQSFKIFCAGSSILLGLAFAFTWLSDDSRKINIETVDKIERADKE